MTLESNRAAPLVSVVVPTYNRPHYLKQALESAVQQTYKNIEIIVSDNCSPESPKPIIDAFDDDRIRFYRNSENLGMFANVKSAFQKARGKYVASLLDDDMWEPEFLSKLVYPLETYPDLALAFCDHFIMDETSKVDQQATQQCSKVNNRANLLEGVYHPFHDLGLVTGAVSTAMAALMRRDILDWDKVPPEAETVWDMYISYLCCVTGLGAFYCPQKLTRVREHTQSETMKSGRKNVQSKIRKGRGQVFCYRTFLADDRLRAHHSTFSERLAHANSTLGIGLMRDRRPGEARLYFWRSLRRKFSLRAAIALFLSFVPTAISSRF